MPNPVAPALVVDPLSGTTILMSTSCPYRCQFALKGKGCGALYAKYVGELRPDRNILPNEIEELGSIANRKKHALADTTYEERRSEAWLPAIIYAKDSDGKVQDDFAGRYEVSSLGRCWDLDSDKELTNEPRTGGYRKFSLRRGGTGDLLSVAVHRLVCDTFIGPLPPGQERRHLATEYLGGSARRVDNRICMLAFGTHRENSADIRTHANQRLERLGQLTFPGMPTRTLLPGMDPSGYRPHVALQMLSACAPQGLAGGGTDPRGAITGGVDQGVTGPVQ